MPVEFSLPAPQGSRTKLEDIPSMGAHSSACSAVTHSLSYSEVLTAGLPNKTSPLMTSAMVPKSVGPYGLNTVVYKKKPSLRASAVNRCLPLIGAKNSASFFPHTSALK
jgi:hypothetical protein